MSGNDRSFQSWVVDVMRTNGSAQVVLPKISPMCFFYFSGRSLLGPTDWPYSANMAQDEQKWTVGRILQWTQQWFAQRNIEGGRLAAELLLARAMGCRKIELYTRYEEEPTEPQRTQFRELVRQAGEHTPIAYLLGEREFFSLTFKVTPAVLIPRPETETLVQRAIEICRSRPDHTWRVLDVGTGSGCIAVALAKYAPNVELVASDISAEALAVAADNVRGHEVADRVRLVEADMLAVPTEAVPEGGFDLVVSNPPYVTADDWQGLEPHVRDHEPRRALVADEGDGLDAYRRLAADAPGALQKGGRLLAEIGHGQHDAVRDIFTSTGKWSHADSHRDPSDPHLRVVEFILNS